MFDNITFFGLGAAGSNTLLNIIRDIPNLEFYGADYDKVEIRNITPGTQPYLMNHINKYKTQAMQMIVAMQTNNNVKLNIINKKIDDDLLNACVNDITSHNKTALFVDCFDKSDCRNMFLNVNTPNISVLHIGFNAQMSGEIVWDNMWTEMNTNEPEPVIDICTLQGARSFIMTLTSLASMVINKYYFEDKKINLYCDKQFNIKQLV